MKQNSRLSRVLHLLLHMAAQEGPCTSQALARLLATNPVVIRRIMAGLRDRGYVQSEKGHGGGWTLACDMAAVTLRDIYDALEIPSPLAIGNRTESPGCLVEQAVNEALERAFQDAENLLLTRLGQVSLSRLSDNCRARLTARNAMHDCSEKAHA